MAKDKMAVQCEVLTARLMIVNQGDFERIKLHDFERIRLHGV